MFSDSTGKKRSKRRHKPNTLSKRQRRIHDRNKRENAKFFKELGDWNWERWLKRLPMTPKNKSGRPIVLAS